MTFQTNYELVPVEQLPDEEGYYHTVGKEFVAYWHKGKSPYIKTNGWDAEVHHWLRPVPSTVLLTKEQVEKMLTSYAEELLKDIAQTFLSPENQNRAERETDKAIYQAIGETIEKFPQPDKDLFIKKIIG